MSNLYNLMVNKQLSPNDMQAFMKIAANWHSNQTNLLENGDIFNNNNNNANIVYKKRERTQNWNHQEKKFLLELCRMDMRIIENKRLDAGLTAVKNKAWKIIHRRFCSQFGNDRTCNRLKEQWRRMKACTRNEIIDYNTRITKHGQEVADRKKPSSFTFEVWDFMQEAKRACKSEALDGIDYSKIPLALEEGFDYKFSADEQDQDQENDDSSPPPQDFCDVDIKEEDPSESFCEAYNSQMNGNADRMSASPSHSQHNGHRNRGAAAFELAEQQNRLTTSSPLSGHSNNFMPLDLAGAYPNGLNNFHSTLGAFNALYSGQFTPAVAAAAAAAFQQHQVQAVHPAAGIVPSALHMNGHHRDSGIAGMTSTPTEPPKKRQRKSSDNTRSSPQRSTPGGASNDEGIAVNGFGGANAAAVDSNGLNAGTRQYLEMQNKEHMMRMRILEVELETAQYRRDCAELEKRAAQRKLDEAEAAQVQAIVQSQSHSDSHSNAHSNSNASS